MAKSKRTPRAVRTDYWRRPVADPSEALTRLHEAKGRLVLAGIGQGVDDEHRKTLAADVDAAQAEVDKCFEKIRFHALPGPKFEALIAKHPPIGDEADDPDVTHNDETFLPALAAACSDNGWTVEDWAEEIAELTVGERQELRETVTHLHTRTWSQQIPKD